MAPRMESRNMMAANLGEREEMESPMARRERHRRFLENRRRKAARSEELEARGDDEKDKPKTPDGFDTPSDDTPSEDDDKKTTTTAPPPPPPTAAPVTQTTPTVETKTTKSLVDAPTNTAPRKGTEPPATSPPPPGPPSPTSTPPPPPPATTLTTSRSLSVNTPITHAPFEKSSATSTTEAPKATASTTSPAALPLLASSSQSLSSVLRGSPSSTFATSTSVAAITSAKITSSAVVAVPKATSAPPTTTSENANTRAGNGKQAGESSSISSILPTTAVAGSRPTAGLGVADQKGVTATTKDTNTRTIGIIIGVLIGSIALIFLAWLLIGRKAKQLRKRRDEVHEKEAKELTFAANRSGASVAESRIWNAASTATPSVGAPSEAGFPGGFPAALPTYPAYEATQKSLPSSYSQPSQLPSPLKVNGLDAHRDVMEFGSPPAPIIAPETEPEEKKSTSWRDSVATMSTIVSVARFRTVKSWAWDQRKRNMADSNIPDLPTMPNNAPYKQLD